MRQGLLLLLQDQNGRQADGQVMFLFILSMAAAEVSVGLALVMQTYHQHKTLDVEDIKRIEGPVSENRKAGKNER